MYWRGGEMRPFAVCDPGQHLTTSQKLQLSYGLCKLHDFLIRAAKPVQAISRYPYD